MTDTGYSPAYPDQELHPDRIDVPANEKIYHWTYENANETKQAALALEGAVRVAWVEGCKSPVCFVRDGVTGSVTDYNAAVGTTIAQWGAIQPGDIDPNTGSIVWVAQERAKASGTAVLPTLPADTWVSFPTVQGLSEVLEFEVLEGNTLATGSFAYRKAGNSFEICSNIAKSNLTINAIGVA